MPKATKTTSAKADTKKAAADKKPPAPTPKGAATPPKTDGPRAPAVINRRLTDSELDDLTPEEATAHREWANDITNAMRAGKITEIKAIDERIAESTVYTKKAAAAVIRAHERAAAAKRA